MSKEKIIIINSKDKYSGTNGDFEIFFNDSSCQQVSKLLIKDCFIPNLFFNVVSDYNNVLQIKQSTNPFTVNIIIPEGQYTIDQLIAELKLKIDAGLISGTVVTITRDQTAYTLKFVFSTGTDNLVSFIYGGNTTMSDIIGLTETTASLSTFSLLAPYNLKGVEYVQIHSPTLAEARGLDGGANGYISLLETVSLANTAFGAIAYRQNNTEELSSVIYTQPRNISRIKIVLRDDTGRRLVLPVNAHMSIMIKIYFD